MMLSSHMQATFGCTAKSCRGGAAAHVRVYLLHIAVHSVFKLVFSVKYRPGISFTLDGAQCVAAVGNIAPTFFFASAMFNFVLLLHNLVRTQNLGAHTLHAVTLGTIRHIPNSSTTFCSQGLGSVA